VVFLQNERKRAMPIYTYVCDKCGQRFDEKRGFEDSHADIECPKCHEIADGKKSKQIDKNFKTIYVQGRGKGNWGRV
jgi:putative FmdB family regulatory protein